MLDAEVEDERDTGFRQVLNVMVTPVSSMCISNSAHKTAVGPERDDKAFVLNFLWYLVMSDSEFGIPLPLPFRLALVLRLKSGTCLYCTVTECTSAV